MKEEEDNPCCLALSARAPCRAALTGHSFPLGTLHVPVQPEQLRVYVSGMFIYGEHTLHIGVYTRSKKFLFLFIIQKPSVQFYPDHTNVMHVCELWSISDI